MRSVIETIRLADSLRSMDAELLVEEMSPFTRAAFDIDKPAEAEAIPVIICARNEQQDLPAALFSLAMSECAVFPIVVDNCSLDETALVAKRMGAQVLQFDTPGKTGALKTGLEFVVNEFGVEATVLATDADVVVGAHWASAMKRTSDSLVEETGNHNNAVYGQVINRHGESALTDVIRTIYPSYRQIVRLLKDQPIMARGNNTVWALSQDNYEALMAVPDNIFVGEDAAMRDAVIATGGTTGLCVSPAGAIVARGDRYSSLSDLYRVITGKIKRCDLYQADYKDPSLVPYEGELDLQPKLTEM